jgi:hypothetical protein
MRSTTKVFFMLLAGLLATLLSGQPVLQNAMGAEHRLLSIDTQGELLGEVLKKISKDTGYRISIDSGWAGLPVSASFKNLPVEQGLRRILAKLNHAIVFNDAERRISIVVKSSSSDEEISAEGMGTSVDDGPPGARQSDKRPSKDIRDPGDIQIIPPNGPAETGVTRKQLEENETRLTKVDSGSIEVTPPSKQGEKGITLREIRAQQNHPSRAGMMDMRPVPPNEVGQN